MGYSRFLGWVVLLALLLAPACSRGNGADPCEPLASAGRDGVGAGVACAGAADRGLAATPAFAAPPGRVALEDASSILHEMQSTTAALGFSYSTPRKEDEPRPKPTTWKRSILRHGASWMHTARG